MCDASMYMHVECEADKHPLLALPCRSTVTRLSITTHPRVRPDAQDVLLINSLPLGVLVPLELTLLSTAGEANCQVAVSM